LGTGFDGLVVNRAEYPLQHAMRAHPVQLCSVTGAGPGRRFLRGVAFRTQLVRPGSLVRRCAGLERSLIEARSWGGAGWGACGFNAVGVCGGFRPSARAAKKEGPSEVVDDGPWGICVTPLYWHEIRRGVAGLTREAEVCSCSVRKSEARRMWSTTGLEFCFGEACASAALSTAQASPWRSRLGRKPGQGGTRRSLSTRDLVWTVARARRD
jgi:hypothetical protein